MTESQTTEPKPVDDIKVTPQMLIAGIKAWSEWEDSDDWRLENLVRQIFEQMTIAAASVQE